MVFLKDWEDFEIAAESMYMQSPNKCRFTLKYSHSKGQLVLKFTDNIKVRISFVSTASTHMTDTQYSPQAIQYKTEIMPDLKKIEKLTGNLMMHMASNDGN